MLSFSKAAELHQKIKDIITSNHNTHIDLFDGYSIDELSNFITIGCSDQNTCFVVISQTLQNKPIVQNFLLDCYNIAEQHLSMKK